MKINRRAAMGVLAGAGLQTSAAVPQQTPSRAKLSSTSLASPSLAAPSLGNLFGEIEGFAQTVEPRLSFLNPRFKDVERWKAEARGAFLDAIVCRAPRSELGSRTLSRQVRDGYTQEEVVFRSTPFTEIPATVLIPQRQLPSRPGIVALHDHGGFYYVGRHKLLENEHEPARLTAFRQDLYEGAAFAAEYARAGYVVLVIDAFYFGGRRLMPDTLPPGKAKALDGLTEGTTEYINASNALAGTYENLTAKTLFLAGATWPGIVVRDDLRSVDYLVSRPEVNPAQIGCVGLSFGGMRAGHLGGLDARIKSTVVCCFMSTERRMLRNDVEHHTWMLYAPGTQELLDMPDIASLTAPNWLLVQYGRRDALFPAEGQSASAEKLSAIYAKAKMPGRFRAAFWDVPHSFPRKMQDEALEWFHQTLG